MQDANDVIYALGLVNGCEVRGGTFVTGVARTDLSGYTMSIESAESVFPPQVIPSADAASIAAPFDSVTVTDATAITVVVP